MIKSILLGRLTKDTEIRYSQTNNVKVAKFTLAVNRRFVKEGEERQADFINIVAYGKLADFAEKYLKQGIQISLCGRIQTRSYDDNNGIKRYVTEIIAESMELLRSMTLAPKEVPQTNAEDNSGDDNDDSNVIPF